MSTLKGCDVSAFQAPGLVDWSRFDFGIVRATYGKSPDKSATDHAKRIRDAGKVLGLYHFFRADQPIEQQFEAFEGVATAVGLGPGDLLPAIDVEDFPGHAIGPADVPELVEFGDACRVPWGDVILYVTQRDFGRLGKPQWVIERPLWVAHYPARFATSPLAKPATPNNQPWSIWQCLVGPLGQQLQDHKHPRAVDQNVAVDPLPTIGAGAIEVAPASAQIPWIGLDDDYWREHAEARNRHLQNED